MVKDEFQVSEVAKVAEGKSEDLKLLELLSLLKLMHLATQRRTDEQKRVSIVAEV